MAHKYTDAFKAKIVAARSEGLTLDEVAKKFGVSSFAISSWTKNAKGNNTKVVTYNAGSRAKRGGSYKKKSDRPLVAFSGSPEDVVRAISMLGVQS